VHLNAPFYVHLDAPCRVHLWVHLDMDAPLEVKMCGTYNVAPLDENVGRQFMWEPFEINKGELGSTLELNGIPSERKVSYKNKYASKVLRNSRNHSQNSVKELCNSTKL
jgi:hypothetical protein